MGVWDNIFGPSKSSSSSSSYRPSQGYWLDEALKQYGATLGKGQESFPGTRVAPFSEGQTEALDIKDFLKYFSADLDIPLYEETGTALSGILSGKTGAKPYTREAGEDYFQSTIKDPTMKRWAQDIRPEIESAYAGPGYWSSARANAVAKGATDMGDWLGEQRGGLMWDIERANREIEEARAGRALSSIGLGMDYGGAQTREATNRLAGRAGVFDFLSREQGQRQAEINAAMQQFAEQNRITDPENLEILMTLMGMGFSTSSGRRTGAGAGYSALSEASETAGTAAMSALIASDKRVKENIKPVKNALEKVRKLTAYVYNYIGQGQRTIGVMAQEVEKILPEAVVEINGVKYVNIFAIQALIIGAINEHLGDK